ncbi:hypothetical protein GQ457_08G013760 [Hibiscus cannabinus]
MDGLERARNPSKRLGISSSIARSISTSGWIMEDVFSGSKHSRRSAGVNEDEEALKWAAIERVGIKLPTVEVRFQHLTIEANCYVGSRALPSLSNDDTLTGATFFWEDNPLLALAGKLDESLRVKGDVTYNGYRLNEFVPKKTSAYISQNDLHVGEMTVQETLDFSARCQGVGTRYDLLKELARREKEAGIFPEADVDLFMKLLGLDICKDTIVGDEMHRGVSGGQKKRVTTGEMIVGPTKTLFMDEISTGLDSSTTYQIVKCLQQIVHLTEATIFVSLLQPAPETFDLFDDIILLSEGQIVYQGPREHIVEFFETCGFKCPERKALPTSYKRLLQRRIKNNTGQIEASHTDTFHHHVDSVLRTEMNTRNEQDGAIYVGALLFGMVINMFNGFSELSMMINRLPVFYKQRDLLFHPAWTFTLPSFLLKLSFYLSNKLIPFKPIARFFKQFLLVFLTQQMAAGLFRLIAGLCRTMVIANTGGALTLLLVFLLGGFIVPKREIPNWLEWAYWISPLSYGYNAFTVNEIFAPRWMNKPASDNATQLGVQLLRIFDVPNDENWYWIGAGALFGFAVLFNILFTIALAYLNPLGKPQAVISEETAEELEANYEGTEGEPRLRRPKSSKDSFPRSLSAADALNSKEIEIQRMSSRTNPNGMSQNNSSLDATIGVAPKRGMVLPFTPLAMSFDTVNYYVDMPPEMKAQGVAEDRLQLLRGVTSSFRPGVLTALMGVSGAGKTTLMDVLAGRKTGGYIEGDIRISGFPKVQETFARISGYCEQTDIHSPQVTVKESLIYSAFLRLPEEVSNEEKMIFVDQVMELVELDNLKDAIVGLPGVTGLSTEQRKRLTIAVELVANPSIIFMDEPTSGLDARAAAIVMRTVRNTVDTGRTVVCTIHQPSIDIFEAFDELLLMKRGGQVIYSGPLGRNSHKIIEYFESIPGVPKIKEKYNPATWMLEVSSVAAEIRLGIDFAEHYKSSSLYQRNKALVMELSTPPVGAKDLYFASQYSQSAWGQFKSCLWKQWWTYWRSPDYNLVRYFFTLVSALLIGAIFGRSALKGRYRFSTYKAHVVALALIFMDTTTDLTMIIGAMYAAVLFVGIANCSTVQPLVATERTVFYRERAAGMYSALPYALAQVLCEVPYVLFQTSYYSLIVYAMVGFQWTAAKFFWFFFVNFFSFLYFTYYGMMTVSITPNHQIAAVFAAAFYAIFNLFSGFFIPRPRIPKWWIWYYWICPVAWTVYGLILSQYGDIEDTIKAPGIVPDPTVKSYIKDQYGYESNFMGPIAGVLVGFAAFFAFMFAYCIKTLNFQTR